MFLQHMLLKLRKHILKYTLNKYLVNCLCLQISIVSIGFSSFKHLKLPISIKIHVTIMANRLYLHDSYIIFDFVNYAFCMVVNKCITMQQPSEIRYRYIIGDFLVLLLFV